MLIVQFSSSYVSYRCGLQNEPKKKKKKFEDDWMLLLSFFVGTGCLVELRWHLNSAVAPSVFIFHVNQQPFSFGLLLC